MLSCTLDLPLERYDGTPVVQRSINIGEPIIYVRINYRYAHPVAACAMVHVLTELPSLHGFGFLPGKEVRDAGVGNLGLQDREYSDTYGAGEELNISLFPKTEREALRWVHKYISAFGGDPEKVTMYVTSSQDIAPPCGSL